ncbi:MAG: redoxin domain-containing protein [Caldimicrobium sp.]|nr:redoxin domain-containing protein [Caldimicrobium sp.]MCX7613074.1 redoxin domain-containing protein [Caldimicrobium sp.]
MEYLKTEVLDETGKKVTLRDILSGLVVIYFYPKNNTPG